MSRFDQFFVPTDEPAIPHDAAPVTSFPPPATKTDTNEVRTLPDTAKNGPEATISEPETSDYVPAHDYTDLAEEQPTGAHDQNDGVAEEEGTVAQNAPLPAAIASRPRTQMKARFSTHAIFNDMVRRDWQRAIAADLMAFDALLYVPTDASETETDPDAGEEDDEPAYTEINANQQVLAYSDPVQVAVLDCPDERVDFTASDSDGEQDGSVDDVMILRIAPPLSELDAADDGQHPIARSFVPVGSILEWNEMLSDGSEVRCWWYVHRIYTYGTAAVGSLYYCIPSRNFDDVSGVDNDESNV